MKVFVVISAIWVFNLHTSECQDECAPYDTIPGDGKHTMCLYPEGSGCVKIARGVTQADIDVIITTHNNLRQKVANGQETETDQPEASNMKQMKWNDELAIIAQRWADQCKFHNDGNRNTQTFTYVGQNKAETSKPEEFTDNSADFNDVINGWYSTVADFDPEIHLSAPEYTQVVWGETTDVGCGYAYFRAVETEEYKKSYFCNYGPGGNAGETVYKQGPACSECDNGCSETYPGLCN